MTEAYILVALCAYMVAGTLFALTSIPEWYTAMTFLLMCKWMFDYRKCTVSYVEVKMRRVAKENGYLFKAVNDLVDFRNSPCVYLMYVFQCMVLFQALHSA